MGPAPPAPPMWAPTPGRFPKRSNSGPGGPPRSPVLPNGLRAAVGAAPLRVDDRPVPVSVSIGAAALDPEVPGTGALERLLTDADARVYAAKNAGRDRVVAGPLPV